MSSDYGLIPRKIAKRFALRLIESGVDPDEAIKRVREVCAGVSRKIDAEVDVLSEVKDDY